MSARGPVEVRIERLVLTGFEASAGERVGEALRLELERLVSDGAPWPSIPAGGALVRIDGAQVAPEAGAHDTGRALARAVYEELGG